MPVVIPAENCNPKFIGIVRDFQQSHPDFQAFTGSAGSEGIVAPRLGADSKPVYNATHPNFVDMQGERVYVHPSYGQQTSGEANFNQWYRDVEGVNQSFEFELPLEKTGDRFVFESARFFPIDTQGWALDGDTGVDQDDVERNFWFTFELHTEVSYEGGEVFEFSGDDDLWVFINGELALDIGGLHPPTLGTIDLDQSADQLGIAPGNKYSLDLFHAERRVRGSNFRVETSLKFTNCEPIFVDPRPPQVAR